MTNLLKTGTKDFSDVKKDLSNIQGGENKRGGSTKVVKSVNMEV